MIIPGWYGEIIRTEILFKLIWHNNYSLLRKIIMVNKAKPITKKEEIKENPDSKIDEDFKGYPHGHARDEIIKPETNIERKIADIDNKDGEKRIYKKNEIDEQDSSGSANAFNGK